MIIQKANKQIRKINTTIEIGEIYLYGLFVDGKVCGIFVRLKYAQTLIFNI